MSLLNLREASREDAATVLFIMQTAFEEYRTLLVPPSGVHRETTDSILEKMDTARWFLALADGRTVGCVMYEPREEYAYLGRLAVVPGYRGRGVARALIDLVETQARADGYARIQLSVRVALPDMRTAYERRGYRVIAYNSHTGFAEPTYLTLEKEFDPPDQELKSDA